MTGQSSAAAPRGHGKDPVEIRVESLSKSFGEHRVLSGIDLTLHRSDILAVVGGSGCGKTVLLNHILGQLTPDAGRVFITDHESPDAPLVDLAQLEAAGLNRVCIHWGVVFQRNALFSGSVYDNIALWLREVKNLDDGAIGSQARAVLGAVGLPSGDDFLELPTTELSGGMAKRLAIARALAMKPQVIFYDEPTTGLDPNTTAQIHDLIFTTHFEGEDAPGGRTTLIITHDKDLLARLGPRILMLHKGRVFFDGTFEAFRCSASPIIRPYFDLMPALQQRGFKPAA